MADWQDLTSHSFDCGHNLKHITFDAPLKHVKVYPGSGLKLAHDDNYHSFYATKDGRVDPHGFTCPQVQAKVQEIAKEAFERIRNGDDHTTYFISHPRKMMHFFAWDTYGDMEDEFPRFFEDMQVSCFPGGCLSVIIRKDFSRCMIMKKRNVFIGSS